MNECRGLNGSRRADYFMYLIKTKKTSSKTISDHLFISDFVTRMSHQLWMYLIIQMDHLINKHFTKISYHNRRVHRTWDISVKHARNQLCRYETKNSFARSLRSYHQHTWTLYQLWCISLAKVIKSISIYIIRSTARPYRLLDRFKCPVILFVINFSYANKL